MTIEQTPDQIEFIKLPAVKALTGISTSKIYAMAANGTFPGQVRLGGRAVAWVKAEVLEWNKDQIEAARPRKVSDESPAASMSR